MRDLFNTVRPGRETTGLIHRLLPQDRSWDRVKQKDVFRKHSWEQPIRSEQAGREWEEGPREGAYQKILQGVLGGHTSGLSCPPAGEVELLYPPPIRLL